MEIEQNNGSWKQFFKEKAKREGVKKSKKLTEEEEEEELDAYADQLAQGLMKNNDEEDVDFDMDSDEMEEEEEEGNEEEMAELFKQMDNGEEEFQDDLDENNMFDSDIEDEEDEDFEDEEDEVKPSKKSSVFIDEYGDEDDVKNSTASKKKKREQSMYRIDVLMYSLVMLLPTTMLVCLKKRMKSIMRIRYVCD